MAPYMSSTSCERRISPGGSWCSRLSSGARLRIHGTEFIPGSAACLSPSIRCGYSIFPRPRYRTYVPLSRGSADRINRKNGWPRGPHRFPTHSGSNARDQACDVACDGRPVAHPVKSPDTRRSPPVNRLKTGCFFVWHRPCFTLATDNEARNHKINKERRTPCCSTLTSTDPSMT